MPLPRSGAGCAEPWTSVKLPVGSGSLRRSEHAASRWHDCAMNEKQRDRRVQAFWGGMLAGLAIGVGLAVVMHVIEQMSPTSAANCGVGCGRGITGNVVLVVFLGLVIGLGLGMGLSAAVPEKAVDSAAPRNATPADQPPTPSA
jgi:formate/nitrite transporter FocA (FNT family)